MASTYLSRNSWGTPTSAKKFTISLWFKICDAPNDESIIFNSYTGSLDRLSFSLNGSRQLKVENNNGSYNLRFITNRKIRDPNAFYHVVVKVDTTQSTQSDRFKMYVNGVQETSFGTATYPSQNDDIKVPQSGKTVYIGAWTTSGQHWNGIMSHFHYVDGTAYDASTFGSTDATTGEWKINTSPTVTYGTNGFFILKDGNSVTDSSSNSNAFTVGGGTLTKSEDNPSNVFCTLNPLQEPDPSQAVTYSFGNTKFAGNWNNWQRCYGTIGANTGKFYYEFKCLNDDGTAGHLRIGWDSIDNINQGTESYYSGLTLDREGKLRGGIDGYSGYDPNAVQMTQAYSGGNFSYTANDILGMAIDIDNNTFSVYKNGNLEINAYSYASASNCSLLKSKGHFIAPSINFFSGSGNANRSCFNFGNGYFETTAVSSAGTNASNNGIFEYNVPSGYTAFSTKGLNL